MIEEIMLIVIVALIVQAIVLHKRYKQLERDFKEVTNNVRRAMEVQQDINKCMTVEMKTRREA